MSQGRGPGKNIKGNDAGILLPALVARPTCDRTPTRKALICDRPPRIPALPFFWQSCMKTSPAFNLFESELDGSGRCFY